VPCASAPGAAGASSRSACWVSPCATSGSAEPSRSSP
jgi:hypothetical protein